MRYEKLFSSLASKNEGAFIPFVVLGDPDKTTSTTVIESLIEGGADALELGFPFSDPIADGPTIQAANNRALIAGTRISDCFTIISKIRKKYSTIPIGLLVYANLIHHYDTEKFFHTALSAGADSLLIADLPVEMSAPFLEVSKKTKLPLVFIAPPNAEEETLAEISKHGSAYTYLLSRAGVTGTESRAEMPISRVLSALEKYNAPPPILAFGISDPEQVREAIASGTRGTISGSAVVRIIEKHRNDQEKLYKALHDFSRTMKAATKPVV